MRRSIGETYKAPKGEVMEIKRSRSPASTAAAEATAAPPGGSLIALRLLVCTGHTSETLVTTPGPVPGQCSRFFVAAVRLLQQQYDLASEELT